MIGCQKSIAESPSGKNITMAFLIGGLICALGQALMILFQNNGMDKDTASAAVSVSLVFLSVLLTGLNVYDNITKWRARVRWYRLPFRQLHGGPALEFKSEGYILGLGAKMFIIAGPVIVYGISASVIYGLIIYLFKLY
jgi:stage V sporulation protein AC